MATLCRAGTVYDRQGDPAKAELLLLRAYSLDPRDLTVGGELVALYRRARRIADARLVQRHLAEVDPQNVFQFVNLASLSSQLGDLRLAEDALKQVIGLRPTCPWAIWGSLSFTCRPANRSRPAGSPRQRCG